MQVYKQQYKNYFICAHLILKNCLMKFIDVPIKLLQYPVIYMPEAKKFNVNEKV